MTHKSKVLRPSLAAKILTKACCKKSLHNELPNLDMKLLDPSFIALLDALYLSSKASCNLFLGLLLPPKNLI